MSDKGRLGGVAWTISALLRLLKTQARWRKIQIGLMICLQIVVAQFEVITIGALIPVLTLAIGKDGSDKPLFIDWLIQNLGFDENELMMLFCVFFVLMMCLVNLLKLLNIFVQQRLAAKIGSDIATNFFGLSLNQNYLFNVQSGTSRLVSNVIHDMNSCIGALASVFNLSLSLFSVVFIVCGIVIYDFAISATITACAVLFYLGTDRLLRRRIVRQGEINALCNADLMVVMREAYAHVIDVILSGSQDHFARRFKGSDAPIRRAMANMNFMKTAPRFVLESGLAVMIAVVVFVYWSTGGQITDILPVIATVGFAFTRILPAAQQVYASISSLRSAQVPIRRIYDVIDRQPDPLQALDRRECVEINHSVGLEDVWYRYGGRSGSAGFPGHGGRTGVAASGDDWILQGISITCPARKVTAITGRTGSGKTTLVNVLATLLKPQEGQICLDGEPMNVPMLRKWRQSVAYVPQTIRLSESTVLENIAFGVDLDEIDEERARDAAVRAQIAPFIAQLPAKYRQRIGEDGVSLSGGQRQRLAIARAIYRNAQMIILDEATSSLDNETERDVMNAICSLKGDVTMLVIAHRLSTIRRADLVYHLEGGRISTHGTYDELASRSGSFSRLVAAAEDSVVPG